MNYKHCNSVIANASTDVGTWAPRQHCRVKEPERAEQLVKETEGRGKREGGSRGARKGRGVEKKTRAQREWQRKRRGGEGDREGGS